MPLSEREQRILEEMEKSLHQDFPRTTTPRTPRGKTIQSARRGAAMFVAGLLVLFAFFLTKQVWIGAIAFGSMVWGIVIVAGSVRGAAPSPRHAVSDLGERIGRIAGDLEQRLKQRYKRH